MSVSIGYACIDCLLASHDSSYLHPSLDPVDLAYVDWTCDDCELVLSTGEGTCSNCEGSGTGSGITCGGKCDLCNREFDGYWSYNDFIMH